MAKVVPAVLPSTVIPASISRLIHRIASFPLVASSCTYIDQIQRELESLNNTSYSLRLVIEILCQHCLLLIQFRRLTAFDYV